MDNNCLKQTRFDSLVSNRDMQLVKAVITFINNNFGTFLGTYIKLMELQRACKLKPSSINCKDNNMFDDIKDFLDEGQKENIEMIMTLMEMMKNDDNFSDDVISNYMSMFNF